MPNIRLKCSCGARLKVPDSVAGGKIRCWQCGAKLDVPGVAGSKTDELVLPEEFQTPWIRITCECGKTIKAPPDWVGKQGQCPRCNREMMMVADPKFAMDAKVKKAAVTDEIPAADPDDIFLHADDQDPASHNAKRTSSATLDSIEVGDMPLEAPADHESRGSAEPAVKTPSSTATPPPKPPFKPATSIPVPPPRPVVRPSSVPSVPSVPPVPPARPAVKPPTLAPTKPVISPAASSIGQDQFIRVTCTCGKVVKAPLEWAGTVGNCPRCGKKILMPKVPGTQPLPPKPVPAPVIKQPPRELEEDELSNEDSAMMDSILNEDQVATLTAKGIPADEWERKKQERAAQWAKHRQGQQHL